ncbi:MAG: helix-turn-helix transcriptional regulator [Chloroflexota bacterium]|nr:helix-turn-helix transcriptional regulator [Chloroflexota bacterium]
MAQPTENTFQRIFTIRKTLQRSVHDCAGILGISEAKYLAFEQGRESLSLPELELLSLYLNIPLQELFESDVHPNSAHHLLQLNIRRQYKRLREKMIQTKLILARESKGIPLPDLSQKTDIPKNTLQAYELGQIPIPLNHLKAICRALDFTVETFFLEDDKMKALQNGGIHQAHWQPEYPDSEGAPSPEEDPYRQLLAALKQIPEEDQARIAKQLLELLKNN